MLAVLALVRERWRLKTLLLLLVIGLLTVGPTISAMVRRAHEGIGSLEQDSAIQTELAVDRFLHGAPIYGADWSNTPLAKMAWASDLAPTNPALHHYVYFPLTFLSAVPVRLLAGAAGLAFDYRMVILLFVTIGLLAVWLLPIAAADRFAIAVALFLNPLITLYLWSGRNDVCFASLVMLGLALLARGRVISSSLAIGFASAFKLFAAPAIPFLLAIVWLRYRRRRDVRELLWSVVALAAFPIATILPFLLQAPHAFIQDVVLYPGGGLPDSYPIAGFGFGTALVLLGLLHRHDYFPFGIFQAAVMAAAGWLGLRAVLGRPTLRRWMVAYVGLFFALSFFARYFNDSHVGVLATMALCCRPLGNGLMIQPAAEPALGQAA